MIIWKSALNGSPRTRISKLNEIASTLNSAWLGGSKTKTCVASYSVFVGIRWVAIEYGNRIEYTRYSERYNLLIAFGHISTKIAFSGWSKTHVLYSGMHWIESNSSRVFRNIFHYHVCIRYHLDIHLTNVHNSYTHSQALTHTAHIWLNVYEGCRCSGECVRDEFTSAQMQCASFLHILSASCRCLFSFAFDLRR